MAQRKSTPTNRPNRPAGKAGATDASSRPTSGPAAKTSTSRTACKPVSASTASQAGPAKRPPNRKPGKSIVNQKQTPWGLIATTAAIVVFAVAIVAVVIATKKDDTTTSATRGGQAVDVNDPYRQPELAAAQAITGITYRVEGQHNHVDGTIKYDASPPIGGNHNQFWANCNGAVYDHQIANENAVHMLEHGAVWITYNPKTATAADIAKLKTYVQGQDRLALSPYAGLTAKISLQAWGYQLFVNSASDPRIAQFISLLKYNQKTTPEPGASCTDPYWNAAAAKSSRPGHPFNG